MNDNINENMNNVQNLDDSKEKEILESDVENELIRAQKAMDDAKKELIKNIINSINYSALFDSIGQTDNYEKFAKYVREYEKQAKEAEKENDMMPHALPWYHFIDENSPIVAMNMAMMWEHIIGYTIHVAIASAQVVDGVVYDTVTAPQFENVQNFLEKVAGAMGSMQKTIDDMSTKITALESQINNLK